MQGLYIHNRCLTAAEYRLESSGIPRSPFPCPSCPSSATATLSSGLRAWNLVLLAHPPRHPEAAGLTTG
jgi:hypothetical protein